MNRNLRAVAVVIVSLTLYANAGTISGKVSGVAGESVVYVDVVQGKTFPAPTAHPLIDQKGLVFTPHLTVVQVRDNRRVSEQRHCGTQRFLDIGRRQ